MNERSFIVKYPIRTHLTFHRPFQSTRFRSSGEHRLQPVLFRLSKTPEAIDSTRGVVTIE